MALEDFATLLGDLGDTFGQTVTWGTREFPGRFRVEPFVVGLPGTDAGIGTTETWLFCERAAIPGGDVPDIGAVLAIAGRGWEIVDVGEDDLGELAFRLIKYEGSLPSPTEQRGKGRPSRREEIERAWVKVAPTIDPRTPLTRVYPAVRKVITGTEAPTPGLTDKTLGKTLRAVRRHR